MCRCLLELGAQQGPRLDGMTPLATAAAAGDVEMVRCLLEKAPKVDDMALRLATDRGHLAVVRCAWAFGARSSLSPGLLESGSWRGWSNVVQRARAVRLRAVTRCNSKSQVLEGGF